MQVLIGLVGENGAGKETFISSFRDLVAPYGVFHVRTSRLLQETLALWRIRPTRWNLQTLAIKMDEGFGKGVLTRALARQIGELREVFVVYDCIRWQSDVDLVRAHKPSFILYVTADQKIRWRRTKRRAEKPGEKWKKFSHFSMEERRETETSISAFGRDADFTIVNNATLEQFNRGVMCFVEFYAKPALNRKVSLMPCGR